MLTKKPTEVKDFEIDWSDLLSTVVVHGITVPAQIVSSVWTVPAGITKDADANSETTTTIRLLGGTWTESYVVTNEITDNGGQVRSQSLIIKIQNPVAYCSTSEVRQAATQMASGEKSSDSPTLISNDDLLDLIERASRIFDQACGAKEGYFNPPLYGIPTARTFYGDGVNYLQLDPYVPGTLNTTLGLPDNYTAPSFIERNGYLVQVNSGVVTAYSPSVYSTGWWSGVPITVTAQWGFEETPADVKAAVIELVINLWRETDPAHLSLIGRDGFLLRESLPPRVKAIANRWKLKVAEAVFA